MFKSDFDDFKITQKIYYYGLYFKVANVIQRWRCVTVHSSYLVVSKPYTRPRTLFKCNPNKERISVLNKQHAPSSTITSLNKTKFSLELWRWMSRWIFEIKLHGSLFDNITVENATKVQVNKWKKKNLITYEQVKKHHLHWIQEIMLCEKTPKEF